MTNKDIQDLERNCGHLEKMQASELFDLITELLFLPGLKEQSSMMTGNGYLITELIRELTAKAILAAHYEGMEYEAATAEQEKSLKNR
ncbi:hypothetical protein [Phaeodactylibacter luteus]|uniref:Uncharacterized protein n=1 Tax=Phaeodactylibacter luteus TaxID=1564516 RepID=A0A5C6RHW9_9BACT|nr:hypothetical protein [Phaeodactylibacter luteus]TXB61634.1 hypothetical protein FRY97_18090 [Phaeodactylibacter luteus]